MSRDLWSRNERSKCQRSIFEQGPLGQFNNLTALLFESSDRTGRENWESPQENLEQQSRNQESVRRTIDHG